MEFDIDYQVNGDYLYVLILWPEVQDLMRYDWFRSECRLHQAFDDQEHLDSAYFVPLKRIMELLPLKRNIDLPKPD